MKDSAGTDSLHRPEHQPLEFWASTEATCDSAFDMTVLSQEQEDWMHA